MTSPFRTPSILRDRESLALAVEKANSKRQVLIQLGLRPAGGNYQQLAYYAEKYELELPDGTYGPKTFGPVPVETYLVRGKTMTTDGKKRLIKEGVLIEECQECGTGPEWNGKPLVLQLDHIDGDSFNNLLGNLRLLCPNCHTQTNTWGRNNGAGYVYRCDCGRPKSRTAKRCAECYRIELKANARPSVVCRCGEKKSHNAVACRSCAGVLKKKSTIRK